MITTNDVLKSLKYSSLLCIPPGEAQTHLCYVHVVYLFTALGSYNKNDYFFSLIGLCNGSMLCSL
jgi:hypothetical protein